MQNLATRLQLQTPPPSGPMSVSASRIGSKRVRQRQGHSFDNPGFMGNEFGQTPALDFLKNEFNASVFGGPIPPPPPQFGAPIFPPGYVMESNGKINILFFTKALFN